MDERSVRNATNPKVQNRLVPAVFGKRTFVERNEAKRWLTDRKGFNPTSPRANPDPIVPQSVAVMLRLEPQAAAKLQVKADAKGVRLDVFIASLISE